MSARSLLLTWKIHRFEVLFVVIVLAVLGVSVWVTSSRILDLGLTDSCWPRDEEGRYATKVCDDLMQRFWQVEGGETGYLRVALTVVPALMGIILGVPIVARELEMRTTALAWSLTPSRARWLLARFLPMLLVGVVGLGLLGWMGTVLFDALWSGRTVPDLTEIAGQGVPLLARGLMAIAVALLIGAIVGRTMPAFLIAAVVMVAWSLVAVPAVQSTLTSQFAVWVSEGDEGWREGQSPVAYQDGGSFDVSKPGVNGEPGARFDYDELERQVIDACGPAPEIPDDFEGELYPEYGTWSTCADPLYERTNNVGWTKLVRRSHYGDYALVDTLMSLLVGGAALLLTFPVVARRRPG